MILLGVTLALLSFTSPASALTADQEKRAQSGEILVEVGNGPGDIKDITVIGTIDAPLETVYGAFTDYAHYKELYGTITQSTIERRDAEVPHVRLTFGIPWPIGDRWVLAGYRQERSTHRVSWNRIDGTMKAFEGAAEFRALSSSKTLMIYQTKADLGVSFIPGWLFTLLQQQTVPSVVHDLRKYVRAKS